MDLSAGTGGPSTLCVLLLREADVLRPSEFEHPVQCVHGDGDFGCSAPIAAGSEPISDDPFEAADVGLHQGTPIIPRTLLPSHASHARQ
jgi:hypothetical protein